MSVQRQVGTQIVRTPTVAKVAREGGSRQRVDGCFCAVSRSFLVKVLSNNL